MQKISASMPYGAIPSKAPFACSASTAKPWGTRPVVREVTVGQAFDETVAAYGPREAVVFVERDWRRTWTELAADVDRLARGLMALGVGPGERIALWATNVPEWLLLMIAAAKIGAVLLPFNTNYRSFEVETALRQSEATTFFTMPFYRDLDCLKLVSDLVPEMRRAEAGRWTSARLPHLKRVVSLGPARRGMTTFADVLALADRVSEDDYRARCAACRPTDVVNMQYTSGTTGTPKGAQLTHRNIVNDAYWIGACMKYSHEDRICIPVPLFHCFGCVLGVMCAVDFGATMVVLEKFDPVQTMMAVEHESCTSLYGVPTMYIAILDHPLFGKFDFRTLRTGVMSGAPCPLARMKQTIARMNMKEICIPYGLTEAGPVMTMTRAWEESVERRCYTVGQALPGIEVAVLDAETREIAPLGTVGELCCRGYNTMVGYYRQEGETAACLDANGWLHSGDLGRMDADGYFHFEGRLKDIIIRGGENISSGEVEDFLAGMPGVADAKVVGVPSKKYGEQPAAYIIRKAGSAIDVEDVYDWCNGRLAWFKIPKYVAFVDAYPLTGSRKVQKFKLREDAAKRWPDA